MKGIVFNLVDEVVTAAHGEDAWDAVLEAAGVDGSYTSLGSYPDCELTRIVSAASGLLGVDEATVLRTVASAAVPLLAARYPRLFTAFTDAQGLVLALNEIIHPEVKKLYPGADTPTFSYQSVGDRALVLGYQSTRRLCPLAEGFVLGTAAWYGQTATVTQSSCMLDGAERCLLHCDFADATA